MKKLFYILVVVFISFPALLVALGTAEKVQVKDVKCIGNERVSNQTIGFYIKLKSGDYINDDDIDSIIKDLYKTKLFASVNAYIDDKKNLVIKIQENPLINKVVLKAISYLTAKSC